MSPNPEKKEHWPVALLFSSEEWQSVQRSPWDLQKYIIAERKAKISGDPFIPPEGRDWSEYMHQVLEKLDATLPWPEKK